MTDTILPEDRPLESIPTAQQMLVRLHEIDLADFDLKQAEEQMRGNKIWINILTIPVASFSLMLFTFLGYLITGQLILSFLIAAGIVLTIGKMFEGFDEQIRWNARLEVERRIAETEGEFGLIVHFKHFLPTRYRHLVQSLKRGRYLYIDQYMQAVHLLQRKLDHMKFMDAWHMVYPHLDPANQPKVEQEADESD